LCFLKRIKNAITWVGIGRSLNENTKILEFYYLKIKYIIV